ncbi:MAG: prepilin-type N-terminal cleavage/methylation domain-containing protein, partial [Candidatus Hydrogenedentes bacterium]|nr:prepilin-type N-terminal cleavage/methylation domain-containing protein [Candidatus Hydrogenedentota bacterium]
MLPGPSPIAAGKSGRGAVTGIARQRAFSPARTRDAGLTLVELMVAMAIFVTVLSGTLLLFNGAISTVRQGYRTMEAFEKARGSMTVLERDLTGAFTARDVGQDFQFYGRPNGFTFVGNVDGSMARVTYAVNDRAARGEFRAELVERYGLLNIRAIEHDKRRGNDPSVNAPIAVALAEYLILSGQLPATATTVPADLYLAAQAEAAGEPFGTPMDINVRIPILVTTGGLVRYVERGSLLSSKRPGITDIDAFDAPLDGAGAPIFSWPTLGNRMDIINQEGTAGAVAAYLEQGNRAIYLNGLEDTLYSLQLPGDRFALDRELIRTLFDARKRDLWVRMVAGESDRFDIPSIWNTPTLNVDEYALTDSIVIRAIPIVEIQPYQSAFNNFDVLNINNHFFDYGIIVDKDESAGVTSDDVYMSAWWNAEENLAGIGVLQEAINTGQGPARDQL